MCVGMGGRLAGSPVVQSDTPQHRRKLCPGEPQNMPFWGPFSAAGICSLPLLHPFYSEGTVRVLIEEGWWSCVISQDNAERWPGMRGGGGGGLEMEWGWVGSQSWCDLEERVNRRSS